MITEGKLVTALIKTLRERLPGCVILKHHDTITAGIPDLSVTGDGLTVWLEVKFANPRISTRAVQEDLMRRLARAGHAYYVVYFDDRTEIRSPGVSAPVYRSDDRFDHQLAVRLIEGL